MQGTTPVECEILNVIQGAGIWPDCDDKTQLLQAINTLISGGGNGGSNTVIIGSEIGTVSAFAMPTAPEGWLVCDGSAISRTDYADLFATIGTVWGAGDEISTFNLPDLRGEFVRGFDDGRGVDAGRVFGSAQTATGLNRMVTSNLWVNVQDADETYSWSTSTNYSGNDYSNSNSTAYRFRPRNVAMTYAIKAFYPTAATSQ